MVDSDLNNFIVSKNEIISYINSMKEGNLIYASDLVLKFNIDFNTAEEILSQMERLNQIHKVDS